MAFDNKDTAEENGFYGASATATAEPEVTPSTTPFSMQDHTVETSMNGHSVHVENGEEIVETGGVSRGQNRADISADIAKLNRDIDKINAETHGHSHLSPMADISSTAGADLSRIEQDIAAKQQAVANIQTKIDETGKADAGDDDTQSLLIASVGATIRGAGRAGIKAAEAVMAELKGSLGKQGISGGHSLREASLFTESVSHGLASNPELEQLRQMKLEQQQGQGMARSLSTAN